MKKQRRPKKGNDWNKERRKRRAHREQQASKATAKYGDGEQEERAATTDSRGKMQRWTAGVKYGDEQQASKP